MTVSSTTTKVTAAGDGSTTTFNFSFLIYDEAHLTVTIVAADDTETVKTLTTHYTVSIATSPSVGGSITFTAGNIPVTGETVVIQRNVPQKQEFDPNAGEAFDPDAVEKRFDLSVMMVQYLDELMSRSLQLPVDETGNNLRLPSLEADGFLRVNAAGDGLTWYDIGGLASVAVSGAMTPVVQAATLAAGLELLVESLLTTRGDILYQGDGSPARLGVGGANTVLKSNGTDPLWGQVVAAMIATGAVTGPKIAMGSDAQGDVLFHNGTNYARLAAGTAGQVLQTQGAGANPQWAGLSGDYILIRDEKSNGTDGGATVMGSWQTRDLNTEVTDTGNNASISSNQVTLDAGTYEIYAVAPFNGASSNVTTIRLRWRNVTDGSTAVDGPVHGTKTVNEFLSAHLVGRFTIAAQKTFELQYWGEVSAQANTGLGSHDRASNGNEVYSTVALRKIA